MIEDVDSDDEPDLSKDLKISVRRDHIWFSTLCVLLDRSLLALIKNNFIIEFENESGF